MNLRTELIFKHGLHASAQAVHIDILTNTILAVLFVTSSKIAPEKCYACCPPLL